MADIMLKTEHLGISFGGLKAVQDVNLEIRKNQLYGLVGPNGAGKTTVFNMLTGVYRPTAGCFYLDGENLTGKTQEIINHKGLARTFQNIRLFNNMSVIRNVMVGLHNQKQFCCNPFSSMFRLPSFYRTETEMRQKAKEILRIFGLVDIIRRIRDDFDMTILLIEHDMKFVAGLCDEITVLNFGTVLAQGDTKEALTNPEVVKAYIGG